MSSKYIVGLDIGTTKIACFIGLRAENGKIQIKGFGKTESVGVEHGIVRNIYDTANSIRRAVSDASEMANYDVEEVYVGIAGQHIKSRPNQGSVMIAEDQRLIEKADVDRLIEEQNRIMLDPGEEIIHVFPQNYIVDNPYPAKTLNEDIQQWMAPEMDRFVFSKQVLSPYIEQGVKDVYLFNDTHWSPASSHLIAAEIIKKLK